MNNTTAVALITLSSLSLATSVTTLALVLFGAKKAKTEIEEVKQKTNRSLAAFKTALATVEL